LLSGTKRKIRAKEGIWVRILGELASVERESLRDNGWGIPFFNEWTMTGVNWVVSYV